MPASLTTPPFPARLRSRAVALAAVLGLGLVLAAPAQALQVQDVNVVSPINGKRFIVPAISQSSKPETGPGDLGEDDDGCRHTSNLSEYDLYLACDPFSYFTCLASEYDPRTGVLRSELPKDTDWQETLEQLGKEYNLTIDRFQAYARAKRQAGTAPIPPREDFAMAQSDIPVEKRYKLAIECYKRRQARSDVLARVAQAGAWALRVRINKPLVDPALDGGYDEVNTRLNVDTKPGERFEVPVWIERYRTVFGSGTLTNEGTFIAGSTLFGLLLREGDKKAAEDVLNTMRDRFNQGDLQKSNLVRLMVTERQNSLKEYLEMTKKATGYFLGAISEEYYPRSRLPIYVFTVAEGLRRTGELDRASQWYYALSKMPETQPRLRDDIRGQGKVPGLSAPISVQLGWKADLALDRLAKAGTPTPGELSGIDKRLLQAVVFDGLGTAAYKNSAWKPRSDGTQADSALVLSLVGQSLIDWSFRRGGWPATLDELWEKEVLVDRNRANRFCDPATGERLLYVPPKGELEQTSPRTVLIATPRPVPTPSGAKYGAYLANNTIVWRDQIMKPGTVAPF